MHESVARIEPTFSKVKVACSEDYDTEAPIQLMYSIYTCTVSGPLWEEHIELSNRYKVCFLTKTNFVRVSKATLYMLHFLNGLFEEATFELY
jgi:hypothetical protein